MRAHRGALPTARQASHCALCLQQASTLLASSAPAASSQMASSSQPAEALTEAEPVATAFDPDGCLTSASLRGPLQAAMLPLLPLPVLAHLRASCSSMKHLVDSLTAGTWAAAAEGHLPGCLIPTSSGDADRCLRVLLVTNPHCHL